VRGALPIAGSSRVLGAALLVATLAAPVRAHDQWLAPSSFAPRSGERVDVHLFLGHASAPEEVPRRPERILRLELVEGDSARAIPGRDLHAPFGIVRPRASGASWLVYQSKPACVEIEPAKCLAFLAEEGLDDVGAARAAAGESEQPWRERYARFAKALLCVAATGATGSAAESQAPPSKGFDRRLGLELELSLASDPSRWSAGEPLDIVLELDGKSLAGRQVKLVSLDGTGEPLLVRTDELGRARFQPPRGGAWGAFAVHERRASPLPSEGTADEPVVDWEGLWASLTFELSGPAPEPETSR
jgi:hypothetical protein